VQHVILFASEHFPKKSGLKGSLDGMRCAIRLCDSTMRHAFPTELAPKSTVNDGSPSKARSMASISACLGKKPGNREKVCLVRS
jgi:hypothetical protein